VKHQSIWRKWTDITLDKRKVYFGVILNTGLNENAAVKHYFSCDWTDYQPFFGVDDVNVDEASFCTLRMRKLINHQDLDTVL